MAERAENIPSFHIVKPSPDPISLFEKRVSRRTVVNEGLKFAATGTIAVFTGFAGLADTKSDMRTTSFPRNPSMMDKKDIIKNYQKSERSFKSAIAIGSGFVIGGLAKWRAERMKVDQEELKLSNPISDASQRESPKPNPMS